MKLLYNSVDITSKVDINKAELTDNAGGKADSLELYFNDPKGTWNDWNPIKNDKVIVSRDGLSSGLMYIDELEQQRGTFIIRALSIPQEAKTENTKNWESVRFLEIAYEIALKYGFTLETYGIENYLYNRVDQFEQTDFEFLAWRCLLEGYMLKITNNKVIIYSEAYMESIEAVETLNINQFDGPYKFKNKSTFIYNSCILQYGNIKSFFKPNNAPYGATKKYTNLYVSSLAEADRFTKDLLRFHNKYEKTGIFATKFNADFAAGSNLNIIGVGISDGKYFCEQIIHNFIDSGKTYFKTRKSLEGY